MLLSSPFSHLALAGTLAFIGVSLPLDAVACDRSLSKRTGLAEVASFGIERPLYAMRGNGRLDRGDLRSGNWRTVFNHEFQWAPHVEMSADGHWVSIHGVTMDRSTTLYWLYDMKAGEVHQLYQHPAWGGSIPAFSPDSRLVLLLALRDSRWVSVDAEGLFLYELATRRLERLSLPEGAEKALENGHVMADWAADGKSLLMVFREYRPKGEQNLDTPYQYSLETRHFRPISGHYDRSRHRHRFFADGAELEPYIPAPLPSHVGFRQLTSRNGRWHAAITEEHELRVSEGDGPPDVVDKGRYDNCVGVTIRINGWIDDKHLVYATDHGTYVYSAADRKKAFLFEEGEERVPTFFW